MDLNFMGNSKHIVLIHKAMREYRYDNPLAIMVTPQFYTLKRVELPVKFHYQVKKLAPSIMEELLPEGREYSYHIYKDESQEGLVWVIIAYDALGISEFLATKGIGAEQVTKLYFAQRSPERFANPFKLGDHDVITVMDETVVVVPQAIFDDHVGNFSFDESLIPENGVSFNVNTNALITFKEAVIVASLIASFGLVWLVEGIRYGGIITALSQPVDELLAQNPALQSQYARENISMRYQKIDKEERAKRDVLQNLSKLAKKGVELESLKMNEKGFITSFVCKDETTLAQTQKVATQKGYKTSRKAPELTLKVEGTL